MLDLRRCAGACYRRCSCSPVVRALALKTIVDALAAILYLYFTKNIGTPFKDSLTEEQLALKKEAAKTRGYIYLKSLVLSAILCFVVEQRILPERSGTTIMPEEADTKVPYSRTWRIR